VWIYEPGFLSPQGAAEQLGQERGPNSVLEVECGARAIAERIAIELDCNVKAIDSSPAIVDAAQSIGVDARFGDVRHLPFEVDSFDAVIAAWTPYYVESVGNALSEIARVLLSSGRLVAISNGRDRLQEL
jgi:ubiquinone/menaquinone biosynthesis C-methylase UbiE